MGTGGLSTTFPVHIIMIWTVLILTAFSTTSSALDYASSISVSADTTSATLTWTVASNASAADSYIVAVLLDGGTTSVNNYTISDVSTETYSLADLVFSTYYTVNLYTVSNTGQTVGVTTVSFWTEYAVWNSKFIAVLGVIGFMFLTLLVMMVLKSVFLKEEKAQDKKPVLEDEENGGIRKENGAGTNAKDIAIF
ncbi:uncharacterized protein LOC119746380 [Patiria miniata]|uniref:Fibronectin type-III domain-containing protein n=1 Tax=Patiria miniata TaxID=46514 RepID=A0A914BSG3_PATMI|nr:uncharacterized protein LOC119746380 [Patiria miniata]